MRGFSLNPLASCPRTRRRPSRMRRERTGSMKLYPKIIPSIARDTVATLMADGDIEVETMRVADAEMDMAAILKEYLAAEERVNPATQEARARLKHLSEGTQAWDVEYQKTVEQIRRNKGLI